MLLTGLGETGVLTAVGLLEFCRRLMRFAPISNEMAPNQIGQHVLGLPKSYWPRAWLPPARRAAPAPPPDGDLTAAYRALERGPAARDVTRPHGGKPRD